MRTLKLGAERLRIAIFFFLAKQHSEWDEIAIYYAKRVRGGA